MTGPLADYLDTLDSVYDHNDQNSPGGAFGPGKSVTIEIATKRGFRQISVAGMLVVTNDAFFAIRGLSVWFKRDVALGARAYDAGSEVNNEMCAYIPGCGGGGVRAPDGAEGFVYTHSGIHGGGDLDPADLDWQNPVATIKVQRIK